MKFFVKDFCEIVQAKIVICGMQVDNDVLYCGIANQPSPAYSSLYLSPTLKKWEGILVYICLSFRPSFRQSVRPSVIP